MTISLITPFYKGNSYMYKYCDTVRGLKENLPEGVELEVILVNDSPGEPINHVANTDIRVIEMPENGGIHKARIMGLTQSTGEYVIFLDQDDYLDPTAVAKLSAAIGKRDIAICNAALEQKSGKALWYRTKYHKQVIWDLDTYINVGTQIMSPGQCLIKRTAIPRAWIKYPLRANGSDDYFLWILMLSAGAKHVYVDEPLYTHCYTGDNLSGSTLATDASTYEFIDVLERTRSASPDTVKKLRAMIKYKAQFRAGDRLTKATSSLANLPTFLRNVAYKKKTDTPLGFNR